MPKELTPKTDIAKRIRSRRHSKHKTLRETAFLVGLHPSVYCRIEIGTREPRFNELENIARALECTVRDLVPPRAA